MIVSDFASNGNKFMAVAYHLDLTRYVLAYDHDVKELKYSIGPVIFASLSAEANSPELPGLFGEEVMSELFKFIESKNESSSNVRTDSSDTMGTMLHRN